MLILYGKNPILRYSMEISCIICTYLQSALRKITEKARFFGAGPLFNQILPLLMSPTLEDQERHLLVKVIDRILYKLDDLVRPYVHKACFCCNVVNLLDFITFHFLYIDFGRH